MGRKRWCGYMHLGTSSPDWEKLSWNAREQWFEWERCTDPLESCRYPNDDASTLHHWQSLKLEALKNFVSNGSDDVYPPITRYPTRTIPCTWTLEGCRSMSCPIPGRRRLTCAVFLHSQSDYDGIFLPKPRGCMFPVVSFQFLQNTSNCILF